MESRQAFESRATTRCGLTEFGSDGWQAGLDHLVEAVETDFGDDADAVARVEEMLVTRLISRLRVEDWYRQYGEEASAPVQGPVVIVGLPRSATTALHYLLATDAQFRFTRLWELNAPVPPPDIHTEHDDPRRRAMTQESSVRHISKVDGPIEDGPLLGLHFRGQELGLPVLSYLPWWREADFAGAFAYHERALRLLHSHRPPKRWLVKGPAYLFQLQAFAHQYPNVKFLFTHRDPVATMPSTCSTVMDAWTYSVPSVTVEKEVVGRAMLEHYSIAMQRAMSDRERLPEDMFLDVAQRDVEHDPVGTAETIYAFLGLEFTDEVRRGVHLFADENPRGGRGEHRYTPEEFGYTVDGIREAFGDYLDRYGSYTSPEADAAERTVS